MVSWDRKSGIASEFPVRYGSLPW